MLTTNNTIGALLGTVGIVSSNYLLTTPSITAALSTLDTTLHGVATALTATIGTIPIVGTATLDFGSTPGTTASVVVSMGVSTISSTSYIDARVPIPVDTDPTFNNCMMAAIALKIVCGNVLNSGSVSSFTIYATSMIGGFTGTVPIQYICKL